MERVVSAGDIGGGEFREVIAPEKIVLSCGALDETGKMMFEFLHTVTLVERRGKTTLSIKRLMVAAVSGSITFFGSTGANGPIAGSVLSPRRISATTWGLYSIPPFAIAETAAVN